MKFSWVWLIVILLSACGEQKREIKLDFPGFEHLAIKVDPKESRSFIFTNKETAFFYGETAKVRDDGYMGFNVSSHKYFDDYYLNVDGMPLLRNKADSIKVFPDHLSRYYLSNITEKLILLDHINCLLIEFKSATPHSFNFMPLISGPDDAEKFLVEWHKKKNLLIITTKDDLNVKYPPFLGIKFSELTSFSKENSYGQSQPIPAFHVGQFGWTSDHCLIAFVVGNTKKEVKKLVEKISTDPQDFIYQKQNRLAKLLENTSLQTNQFYFNKAFQWAIISMDQLIMNQEQSAKGIFAGLPWFNNYWGRDTFISLPGALLVSGRFKEAKEVLSHFAQFQQKDNNNNNFGRLPNYITPTDTSYNTVDGTPWFVRELWEYYLYTGDKELLKQMYPVVKRSIQGTLQYHIDSHYFITHKDAETWMDAQTTKSAWSPRGNRAVEAQALWFEQLLIGSKISKILGKQYNESNWQKIAEVLKKNFNRFFWNRRWLRLYDHLNEDNSPDDKVRPNQIFAITVPHQPLLNPEHELMVLKEVVSKLTYPYGVASLWQHDPDFHPYHVYPQFYPKDEAYHNGTVWGWLAGPVISSLIKYGYTDLAYELLESESYQILEWGAVGTLSELLDAIPRKGKNMPQVSGTVSQAWSIAEYLRNVYQDMLGIKIYTPERKIVLAPRLPHKITYVNCRIPHPTDSLNIKIRGGGSELELEAIYKSGKSDWTIELTYPETRTRIIKIKQKIAPHNRLRFSINFHSRVPVRVNNKPTPYSMEEVLVPDNLFSYLSFAVPQLDSKLKCLQLPPYSLLSEEKAKAWNPMAKMIFNIRDPLFDDKGPNGRYQYPLNTLFQDGILDIIHFQIFYDQQNYYFRLRFRNLVQPGWHPEYGFQLTYVAIAIDQNRREKSDNKEVLHNANYRLPTGISYNKIIYVGGGLQVEDSKGKILVAYHPSNVKYPLGDVSKKIISFAIPKKYLGEYDPEWRFIVLVGAQDDHGGAGLGEFRAVHNKSSTWYGGGGDEVDENCNVYDFILPVK